MTPIETVKKIYEAYSARNIEHALSYCNDDVVFRWNASAEFSRFCGECDCKSGFLERLVALDREFEYLAFTPVEIFGEGDRVASRVDMHLKRRSNGQDIHLQNAQFWTVREGSVVEMTEFYDTALIAGTEQGLSRLAP